MLSAAVMCQLFCNYLAALYIHRNIQQHRTFAASHSKSIRFLKMVSNLARILNIGCIFCYTLNHRDNVCFLKTPLAYRIRTLCFKGVHLSRDENNRDRIKVGVAYAGDQIGSAWSTSGICHTCTIRSLCITTCLKSCGLLMITYMCLNSVLIF